MKHYHFSIPLTVRVSDLNYGNHVGYQNFFSFFQEARIAYLKQFNYSEFNIGGHSMIIAEANCKYKQELKLNDRLIVACGISDLKSKLFVMEYQISRKHQICAEGFTKNLCYNYQVNKVKRLPKVFIDHIKGFEKMQH